MADDHYAVLGIHSHVAQNAIERAYRELAKKYHPDVNKDDLIATEKFREVQAAFDVLSDPYRRHEYDAERWVRIRQNKPREDYYTILGIHRLASLEEIYTAHAQLAGEYPEAGLSDDGLAREFRDILIAFEVLSDPVERNAYNDTTLSFKTTRTGVVRDPMECDYDDRSHALGPEIGRGIIVVLLALVLLCITLLKWLGK